MALINKFYQNLWKSYQKEKNVFVCQLPGCERVHAGVRRGAVDEGALEQINWNLANWNDRVNWIKMNMKLNVVWVCGIETID